MSSTTKTKVFQSVATLLATHHTAGVSLSSLIKQLKKIQDIWTAVVSAELAEHSRPTFYANGRLTISADSPVWANSIRHNQTSLVQRLRQHGLPEVEIIQTRVLPADQQRQRVLARRKDPSPNLQQVIQSAAMSIQDVELRTALIKLSKTLR
jgi:hypothetical protein